MEDFIITNVGGQGGTPAASGSLAARLLRSNMSTESLRTNDILRYREWVNYDEAVVAVSRQRLVVIQDLMNLGLVYPIENALGTTRIDWETVGDMYPAEISMSAVTEGMNDRAQFQLVSLPLPITHKDFKIDIRTLEASRHRGESLDVTQAKLSARLVAESLESMVFNGWAQTAVGANIYGLTTQPSRKTGSLTGNWSSAGATTGEQILLDLLSMVEALAVNTNNMFGPYALYLPYLAYARLADDFKVYGDQTIMERLMAIPELKIIRGSNYLTTTNTILVQLTEDVIDLVDGIEPTTIQWDEHGGLMVNMKVLAIMVPRVKATQTGQCGVAHFS